MDLFAKLLATIAHTVAAIVTGLLLGEDTPWLRKRVAQEDEQIGNG